MKMIFAVTAIVLAMVAGSAHAASIGNGSSLNGWRTNGYSLNGWRTNGISRNGLGRNGLSRNGLGKNGSSAPSTIGSAELIAVELSR